MRRLVPFLVTALLFAAAPAAAQSGAAFAQPGKFGLGVGGSSRANGITGKYYFTDRIAVQASAGAWFPYGVSLDVDGLYDMPSFYRNDAFSLNWYLGAGVGSGFFDRNGGLGLHGFGGVGFQLAKLPLEVTAELGPSFFFGNYDWGGFRLEGGGAVRWYFL